MDGKIRFDLKQISAWDRQNENDLKKKGTEAAKPKGKSSFFKKDPNAEEGDGTGFDHGYRDRALERRKETPAEDAQMEEIVSKLDAEQTKFLGGDMEHTHLVRGLDYALLEKVRKQKEKEDLANASAASTKAHTDLLPLSEIQPNSHIGTSMLRFLTKQSQSSAILGGKNSAGVSVAGSILQRTVFEFDTQPGSEVDVPLMVTRSRKEFTHNEEYVNCVLNGDLFHQLCGLMEHGKLLTAKQKKKRALKEAATSSAAAGGGSAGVGSGESNSVGGSGVVGGGVSGGVGTSGANVRIVDDDDIYGDDLVVGKYVPAGLEDAVDATSSVADSASGAYGASTGVSSARGVFSNSLNTNTTTSTNNTTSEDLMKPIRDLLGAQQAKEHLKQQRILQHTTNITTATNNNNSMVIEKDTTGKLLVHRDVFASTKDKVVQGGDVKTANKLGEVFGVRGGYDLFPETTGSYEQYDSDEGETGDGPEEPAHKKPKTSSGGGSSGTSGGGGSGGGGTGGGGGGGGANRAARRAGAGK